MNLAPCTSRSCSCYSIGSYARTTWKPDHLLSLQNCLVRCGAPTRLDDTCAAKGMPWNVSGHSKSTSLRRRWAEGDSVDASPACLLQCLAPACPHVLSRTPQPCNQRTPARTSHPAIARLPVCCALSGQLENVEKRWLPCVASGFIFSSWLLKASACVSMRCVNKHHSKVQCPKV